MAALFFDGERLVLEHFMAWVTTDGQTWAIQDTDGGQEHFRTKAEAKARLKQYADEG